MARSWDVGMQFVIRSSCTLLFSVSAKLTYMRIHMLLDPWLKTRNTIVGECCNPNSSITSLLCTDRATLELELLQVLLLTSA